MAKTISFLRQNEKLLGDLRKITYKGKILGWTNEAIGKDNRIVVEII